MSVAGAVAAAEVDFRSMRASENNRKAKFYSITRAGRKRLASEAENASAV